MMRPAKILLVTDAVGGMWTYSVELGLALRRLGFRCKLAVIGPPPGPGRRLEARDLDLILTGLPLDWTAEEPDSLAQVGPKLAAIAARENADLLQVGSAACLAGGRFHCPTVAVQHSCVATWWDAVRGGPLPPDLAWRRDMVRRGLERADVIIAPSAAHADQTRRAYRLTKTVLSVHNGRRATPVAERKARDFVFTVGRLWDEGKNVRTLDRAAARIGVPFEAAGPLDGPNGASIRFESLATPGELTSRAIADKLASRPVFASAALYEPFGLAVLEAALAGCPLVLSDIPTFRELWGEAALFVDPRDDEGFARIITDLIESPDWRLGLGLAAKRHARRLTTEATAQAMAAIYEGLLGEGAELKLAGAA